MILVCYMFFFTQIILFPVYANLFWLRKLILLLGENLLTLFSFFMLLDLTDVCPLLTKQYIQVGLQIQYIF
jgi:hypothetical protein